MDIKNEEVQAKSIGNILNKISQKTSQISRKRCLSRYRKPPDTEEI
jgi:hypothetical protein